MAGKAYFQTIEMAPLSNARGWAAWLLLSPSPLSKHLQFPLRSKLYTNTIKGNSINTNGYIAPTKISGYSRAFFFLIPTPEVNKVDLDTLLYSASTITLLMVSVAALSIWCVSNCKCKSICVYMCVCVCDTGSNTPPSSAIIILLQS